MATTFHQDRAQDSKLAHLAAQHQFYPNLWPDAQLDFRDVTETKHDLRYAIDVLVGITPNSGIFRAPLMATIQERWRFDLAAMKYQDITVTEWNLTTNLPSELYKLQAQFFVYGFYDKELDKIISAYVMDVPRFTTALTWGKLEGVPRKRDGQDQQFQTYRIEDLDRVDAIIYRGGENGKFLKKKKSDDNAVLF